MKYAEPLTQRSAPLVIQEKIVACDCPQWGEGPVVTQRMGAALISEESETLHRNTITYNVSFPDFQFLQAYMARRIFAKNRQKYVPALLGVVLCAVFLTMTIVLMSGLIEPSQCSAQASAIRCLSTCW